MANVKNNNGLYQKSRSVIKESVKQCEGLYKKKEILIINNPKEDDIQKITEENKDVSFQKILKG